LLLPRFESCDSHGDIANLYPVDLWVRDRGSQQAYQVSPVGVALVIKLSPLSHIEEATH
jgi:hypothetical protein